MTTMLPAWLVIWFIVAVSLATAFSTLSVLRYFLRLIGATIGAAITGTASQLMLPRTATLFEPGLAPPAALTNEQKLRARAEGIAAVTGTDPQVVLAALREGGDFSPDIEAAAGMVAATPAT